MVKNKKIISLALSSVLALSAITPAFAVEDNSKVKKDETVYVLMDDKGKIKEQTVSVWLRSDDKIDVLDTSNLKDIKNLKGDEKPKKSGKDKYHWKSEKKDIYYQGKSDKELPVDIKITYRLNGKKTSLNKLEGKSGKLEIEIEALNKESYEKNINGKNQTIYSPYIVAGGITFSTDHFKNLETNGKILDDGKTQVVGFSLFPGMAETFNEKLDTIDVDIYDYIEKKITITADVKDFEKPTTLLTAADLFQTDPEFEEFDSFDELTDALEELDDKGQEMLDGAIELYDGSIDFSDAIYDLVDAHEELFNGSNDLYDGANKLQDSMEEALGGSKLLASGSADLNDGARTLNKGLYDLTTGVLELYDKTDDLVDGAHDLKEGADELSDGISMLNDGSKALDAGIKDVVSHVGDYQKQAHEAQSSMEKVKEDTNDIKTELAVLRSMIAGNRLSKGESTSDNEEIQTRSVEDEKNENIKSALNNLQRQSRDLKKTANTLNETANSLKSLDLNVDINSSNNIQAVDTRKMNEAESGIKEAKVVLSRMPITDENVRDSVVHAQEYLEDASNKVSSIALDVQNISNTENEDARKTKEKAQIVAANAKAENTKNASSLKELVSQLNSQASNIDIQVAAIQNALDIETSKLLNQVDLISAKAVEADTIMGLMVEQMAAINAKIDDGIENKLPTLQDKVNQLLEGVEKLYDGSVELKDGQSELYEGTLKLQDGVEQLKDGSTKLYDGSTELQEGTQVAVDGTATLDEGLNKLQLDGISPLKDGVGKLSGGITSLYNKGGDLTEAADDLVDGTEELKDGVDEYMEDGIKEMRSKVTEKTDDIEDIMEIRDELVSISQNRTSFTGSTGFDSKVVYVFKVE